MTIENPILQRAIDHFKAQAQRIVEVPEWGDGAAPLVIHSSPMNMQEKNILARGSGDNDMGILIDIIILKAEDGDGEKLFTKQDKPHFMRHVDVDIITRVAGELLETISVDDHLGNSEPTASGSS